MSKVKTRTFIKDGCLYLERVTEIGDDVKIVSVFVKETEEHPFGDQPYRGTWKLVYTKVEDNVGTA